MKTDAHKFKTLNEPLQQPVCPPNPLLLQFIHLRAPIPTLALRLQLNQSINSTPYPLLDERLFLRLEPDASEKLLLPCPLLLHYRKFLGENAALLKEVQHIPSGLTLRPSSDTAAPRLEELFLDGIREGKLNGATGIEKAQNLATYVISFVPRSFFF
ncbi:hypothetical protein K3495_g7027 [Podosphaera aphanis]|nr:hypothetical protein K3495_g7027 [Podosphaera aphanis]